jgi:hypothetical protein
LISDDRVTVTSHVGVAPAVAFDLFTREVDTWWRRGPRYRHGGARKGVMRFEPGVGGRLVESYDEAAGDLLEIGRVRVWEPARRLVFEWRGNQFEPGQLTEVEIRFEAFESGTRIILEHRGWDAIPAGHPARHDLVGPAFTRMMGFLWADQLIALRAHAGEGVSAEPASR